MSKVFSLSFYFGPLICFVLSSIHWLWVVSVKLSIECLICQVALEKMKKEKTYRSCINWRSSSLHHSDLHLKKKYIN